MKRISLLTFFVACLSFGMMAQSYVPQTVPNPKDATHNGWISDPAKYLTQEQAEEIDEICWRLKKGVEVEVAVVMLPGYDRDSYDRFNFCQELFNLWGIGGSEKNTGVLVFFADGPTGSRDIRIHTGGGMEGLLTDYACSSFIDDAFDALSDGRFGEGVVIIMRDMEQRLMTTEAQSELLLGWKPQHAEGEGNGWMGWIAIGFIVALWISIKMYKKAPVKREMTAEEWGKARKELTAKQPNMGWLGFLLWPVWLLYLFIRLDKKSLDKHPIKCPECGKKLYLVPEADAGQYLNERQLLERKLQSRRFDVFKGADCNHIQVVSSAAKFSHRYDTCPECGAMARHLVSGKTLKAATYSAAGEKENTYVCDCCGKTLVKIVAIPMLVRAAASSYSSGSSSSRSSYHSSSHSSGGSWGGGHSYGGGSGRSF